MKALRRRELITDQPLRRTTSGRRTVSLSRRVAQVTFWTHAETTSNQIGGGPACPDRGTSSHGELLRVRRRRPPHRRCCCRPGCCECSSARKGPLWTLRSPLPFLADSLDQCDRVVRAQCLDTQPIELQSTGPDLVIFLNVKCSGDVLDVEQVWFIAIVERQQNEAAIQSAVRLEWQHLEGDAGQRGHLDQALELLAHHVWPTDIAAQGRLIDDRRQLKRVLLT